MSINVYLSNNKSLAFPYWTQSNMTKSFPDCWLINLRNTRDSDVSVWELNTGHSQDNFGKENSTHWSKDFYMELKTRPICLSTNY